MLTHTTCRETMFRTVVTFTCGLLFGIAGCSVKQQKDGAPASSGSLNIGVSAAYAEDAVPRLEPVTRKGNTNPYTVFGKTYHLLPSSEGYSAQGMASWYGTKFHGKQTSNGEIYDLNLMTAAHKTLPIPCYVRVINRQNGRSAIVRVNDRGPFHGDRLIDLSHAAAVKLGFADRGTAPVFIETVMPDVPGATQDAAFVPAPNSHWYLQAGAFQNQNAATALGKKLAARTDLPVQVKSSETANAVIYRVRVGPVQQESELHSLQRDLQAAQLGAAIIVREVLN
ncbi:MAG: septal ring lytic transglycosylase RlpA family protein [Pseudomonadales bacterium]